MSLILNERLKLTAAYLNGAAGALFAAGVVAPLAAAIFGVTTASLPTLTFAGGVVMFFVASVGLHVAARFVLKGLKP